MATVDLESTAQALVADGKGLLAADETPTTLTRRFVAFTIDSTPESRRAYREMLFTTPGVAQFISGVIMQDETIRQKSSTGTPLADVLAQQGVMPGIKIVFLSGGQDHLVATMHLNAINRLDGPKPWKLGFSYGRALQDEALQAWQGKHDNVQTGQRVFYHRAKCVSAAALGTYTKAMEGELARA